MAVTSWSRQHNLLILLIIFLLLSLLLILQQLDQFVDRRSSPLVIDTQTQETVTATVCPGYRIPPAKDCAKMDGPEFKELMEARRDRVASFCGCRDYGATPLRRHKRTQAVEVWRFDRVGEHGVNWCPVFKAASSSTSALFCPIYYEDCQNLGAEIWRHPEFSVGRKFRGGAKEGANLLVVRNPFDRILSAYRDKIQSPNPNDPYFRPVMHDIVGQYRPISPDLQEQKETLINAAIVQAEAYLRSKPNFNRGHQSTIQNSSNPYLTPISATFEEFILGVLDGFTPGSAHWTPVLGRCAPCAEEYDFILHSEDFSCEVSKFLEEIGHGAGEGERGVTEKVNFNPVRAKKDNSEFIKFYASLPTELLERLYEWYQADCELFGYDCKRIIREVDEWRENHA